MEHLVLPSLSILHILLILYSRVTLGVEPLSFIPVWQRKVQTLEEIKFRSGNFLRSPHPEGFCTGQRSLACALSSLRTLLQVHKFHLSFWCEPAFVCAECPGMIM